MCIIFCNSLSEEKREVLQLHLQLQRHFMNQAAALLHRHIFTNRFDIFFYILLSANISTISEQEACCYETR